MIKEEEKINDEEEKKKEKAYGIFKIKHLIRYKYVALRCVESYSMHGTCIMPVWKVYIIKLLSYCTLF